MRRALSLAASFMLAATLTLVSMAGPAAADTEVTGFEDFAVGSPDGQFGWSATGSAGAGCAAYDHAIVDNIYGIASFGAKSLRISNAVTSGCFGDQTFSSPLADEAGETDAINGGMSAGTRQPYFRASWDFASADPSSVQPDLSVVASPDRGDGARMSWIQMADTPSGLEVNFYEYVDAFPFGAPGTESDGYGPEDDFVFTPVATGLDRTVVHDITLTMQLVDGQRNDIVTVCVDGTKCHTGTSWEDYFRFVQGPPAGPEWNGTDGTGSRTIDSVLFRTGGASAPVNAGKGFLIDNLHTTSSPVPASSTVVVDPVNMNGWGFFNEGATGSGALVFGPTGALNDGSAQLVVDATGRHNIGTLAFGGTRLDQISELSYSSYRASADPGNLLAISLQFEFDDDLTDADDTFRGRLVFEPYLTVGSGNVAVNTWYRWSTLDGKWWSSNPGFAATCSQASPCTIQKVLATWPNAGIRKPGISPTSGLLNFRAGGPWTSGFDGNVDDFRIAISGSETIFDFEPVATLGSCFVNDDTVNKVLTLLADCTTDVTLTVPDDYTFDGNTFKVTAVDPAGGHFLGAVIRNDGDLMNVQNLTIDADGLADVCDPVSPDTRLRGILLDGASGTIASNTLDVGQGIDGMSGCQEGNAIEARNPPFDTMGSDTTVVIEGNVITGYIKGGVVANGSVAATILDNAITGWGPVGVPFAAQNGIQVGFGATAEVEDNWVTGNYYTPKDFVACGLLLFDADGVKARRNTLFDNERDLCNFGRGGGTFNANVP